ncbi:GNAT family N-acetyltransferase [Streptomyces buecherae]|uniref:GNAT family N-acetyltransferase n=1 Tax=Streptomyces buecherae TaxID=2763006 RepID=UPI0033EA9805
MEIRRTGEIREVVAAEHLFDGPARVGAVERFLHEPGHHLLIAYAAERPVGMITGVETTHPDKGAEMFLYELSVDPAYRRRGVGGSLVRALAELARDRGCYGMWVGTERDNTAALATYRAAGATDEDDFVALAWSFRDHD